MIPLHDNIPHDRFPLINLAIVAANVAAFFYELSLGPQLEAFFMTAGVVPQRFQVALQTGNSGLMLEAVSTLFSYMFLHGGWLHIIGNLWILWIFGTVGASGAVAGVMGAYFLLFPRARIRTLVPIFVFIQIVDLPAFIFLGIWFVMQFLMGAQGSLNGAQQTGVAWWAHVGGFIAGMLAIHLFTPRRQKRTWVV
jgi:membrane associated rhomboid family serine protease